MGVRSVAIILVLAQASMIHARRDASDLESPVNTDKIQVRAGKVSVGQDTVGKSALEITSDASYKSSKAARKRNRKKARRNRNKKGGSHKDVVQSSLTGMTQKVRRTKRHRHNQKKVVHKDHPVVQSSFSSMAQKIVSSAQVGKNFMEMMVVSAEPAGSPASLMQNHSATHAGPDAPGTPEEVQQMVQAKKCNAALVTWLVPKGYPWQGENKQAYDPLVTEDADLFTYEKNGAAMMPLVYVINQRGAETDSPLVIDCKGDGEDTPGPGRIAKIDRDTDLAGEEISREVGALADGAQMVLKPEVAKAFTGSCTFKCIELIGTAELDQLKAAQAESMPAPYATGFGWVMEQSTCACGMKTA